jgi:hypothetical protein
MAEQDSTTKKRRTAKKSSKNLFEMWSAFLRIKDDPKKLEILDLFLDVLKAKREGRLTPEGEQGLSNFIELVDCIHRLHCKAPAPNPEQAQALQERIKELSNFEA